MQNRWGGKMRRSNADRMVAMAEAIRAAGSPGLHEARLAWQFHLSFASVRCNYRAALLEIFPDIRFTNGTYTSDPVAEAEFVLRVIRAEKAATAPPAQEGRP